MQGFTPTGAPRSGGRLSQPCRPRGLQGPVRAGDAKVKAGLQGAANKRRKYLSAMLGWACEQDPPLLKSNPARDVRRIKYATSGFHNWTTDEVKQFR